VGSCATPSTTFTCKFAVARSLFLVEVSSHQGSIKYPVMYYVCNKSVHDQPTTWKQIVVSFHPYINKHWACNKFDKLWTRLSKTMITNRGLSFPLPYMTNVQTFLFRAGEPYWQIVACLPPSLAKPAPPTTVCQTDRNHDNKVLPLPVPFYAGGEEATMC